MGTDYINIRSIDCGNDSTCGLHCQKDRENQAVINEIMNEHKSEVNDLRKTIENNTLIVTKLYERLSNEK